MPGHRMCFAVALSLLLAIPHGAWALPTGFEAAGDSGRADRAPRDPWRVTETPPRQALSGVELARADASPRAALATSLVATLVPVAVGTLMLANSDAETGGSGLLLVGTGLVVGPSTGYASAGMSRAAGTGLAIRGLTALVAVGAGAAIAQSHMPSGFDGIGAGIALLGTTGVIVSTSAVHDLVMLPEAVARGRARRLELESH